jgi:hypothetical protein
MNAMTFPQEFRDTRACPPIADQSDIRWRFLESCKQSFLLPWIQHGRPTGFLRLFQSIETALSERDCPMGNRALRNAEKLAGLNRA